MQAYTTGMGPLVWLVLLAAAGPALAAGGPWGAPMPGPATRLAGHLNASPVPAKAPDGLPTEIILYVAGGNDKSFNFSARMHAVVDATPELIHLHAPAPADLVAGLKRLKDLNVRVSKLAIDAHGAPAHTEVISRDNLPQFDGLGAAFSPNAKILFHSCSVANGEAGRRFLVDIGKTLLPKGGTITAAVGTYYFYGSNAGGIYPILPGYTPQGYIRYTALPGGMEGLFGYVPFGAQEYGERADAEIRKMEGLARLSVKAERMVKGLGVQLGADALDAQAGAMDWLADRSAAGAQFLAQSQLDASHRLARSGSNLVAPTLTPAVDAAHGAAGARIRFAARTVKSDLAAVRTLAEKGIERAEDGAQAALDAELSLREAALKAGGIVAREAWEQSYYGMAIPTYYAYDWVTTSVDFYARWFKK